MVQRQGAMDTVRFRTVLIFLSFVGFLLPATGLVVPARALTYQPHSPITIDGNTGFTSANGVTGGSGTVSDPYIIQGWDINASGIGCCNANGNAGLVIENTNASFIVRNVYVHQGLPVDEGIILHQVSNGTVENSVTSQDYFGIAVDSSINVTVTGTTVYSNYDLVYHNNLDSNGQSPGGGQGSQVMDSPTGTGGATPPQNTTNKWDDGYPQGGNYYSDNRGQDYCSGPAQNICGYPDGISDTSYPILSEFVYNYAAQYYYITSDHYPLIRPFTTTTTLPDFQISSSSSHTLSPGSTASITVTLASIQNYASQITISTSTDAPNTSVSPATTVVSLNPGSQISTILTVAASSNSALGTYYL